MTQLITLGLALALSVNAFASFQNPNSILPGDRAAGMGGAGASLLGDVSSAAFYNPALLALAEGRAFSAAVGVYKKFDTLYGETADYTKTPLRINTGFFRALPSSSGNIMEFQDWKLGLSIVVPDFEQFKGDLANTDSQTTTLTYTDESLWVGGAASRKIDETSSFGMTAYYTARNYVRSIQDKVYSGTDARIYTNDLALTQNSLIFILGYFKKVSDQFHYGISARLPSVDFSSEASYFEDEIDTANSANNKRLNQSSLKASIFIPAQLRLGLTFMPNDKWTHSADLTLQEGKTVLLFDLPEKADLLRYKATGNINLGTEYRISESFRIRTGIFSNISAMTDPKISENRLLADHVNQMGFSANLNYLSEVSKISYTFGGYYTGGNGYALTRNAHQLKKTTKSTNIFTMLVGTSFHF
jgi:long-subunit fatty acid transport protein